MKLIRIDNNYYLLSDTLIKSNTKGFYVSLVDDETYLDIDELQSGRFTDEEIEEDGLFDDCFVIIASTDENIPTPSIDKNNIIRILLDKLSWERFPHNTGFNKDLRESWIKQQTLDIIDVDEVINQVKELILSKHESTDKFGNLFRILHIYKNSNSQKKSIETLTEETEWDVNIETTKCTDSDGCYLSETNNNEIECLTCKNIKPKVTKGYINILNIN